MYYNNINDKQLIYNLIDNKIEDLIINNLNNLEGLNILKSVLKLNKSLKKIDIYHSRVYDINLIINIISNYLKTKTNLQELYLRNNFIDKLDLLSEALKVNNSLKVLDLSDNDDYFKKLEDISPLVNALKVNTSIQKLILNRNSDIININLLLDLLKSNNNLKILKINVPTNVRNITCQEFLEKISEALKVNSTLKTLDLMYIVSDNLDPMADALKVNNTLEKLCFQICYLKNLDSIADALKVNSSLKILSFKNCHLKDNKDDLKNIFNSFGETLKVNKNLKILYSDPFLKLTITQEILDKMN